ncbi:MAG: HAD-IIB family hydrolase [Clostridia bacterium]|nr:HAD-IIB family hydrolase [Clostridia bacterium]
MGKFDGYLFYTDFDNTFTLPGGNEISKANCDAVRYFQSEGGRFSVATGRSPNFIQKYAAYFTPNAPLITLNGTMITSEDGETILKEYLLDERVLDVVRFLLPIPYMQCVYFGNGVTQYNRMTEGTLEEKMAYYAALSKPWYKVVTRQDEKYAREVADALKQKFGDLYEFDRSYAQGIEIHRKGSGKGACMEWVRQHSRSPIRVTVAAGDYENDISMIQSADIGYAVQNAIDAVKQAADRITSANTEDAIARIIEDLDRNPV